MYCIMTSTSDLDREVVPRVENEADGELKPTNSQSLSHCSLLDNQQAMSRAMPSAKNALLVDNKNQENETVRENTCFLQAF